MKQRKKANIRFFPAIILLIFQICSLQVSADNTDVWNDVKSGKSFIIMRHALAPGNGDPENFDLTQCKTQRNLSTEGIQQAQRIGETFRDHGITDAEVYSSQWCRCIDTATAMNLQQPKDLPLLNSFYENREKGPAQTKALLQWLKNLNTEQPVILVTHQVVITALTGVFPASGEAVVFKLKENVASTDVKANVDVIHRMLVE